MVVNIDTRGNIKYELEPVGQDEIAGHFGVKPPPPRIYAARIKKTPHKWGI